MSMIRSLGHDAVRGFTLIESIIVILLIGILAAVAAVFIVEPFRAATDTVRRAELVESAETAMDRMTREIRIAVPNSIRRHDSGNALELLRAPKGGRYRRLRAQGGGGDTLNRAQSNDTFDVLGGLGSDVELRGAGRDCAAGAGDCMVIANTGTTGFDAYAEDNVAAIVDATPDTNDPANLEFDTGGQGAPQAFPAHSPRQRFQVIDTVVRYVCENDRINRYFGYGLNESPDDDKSSRLASDVEDCDFQYDSGAGQRHGLVTIDLTISRDGETVRLVDQAHVVNVP